MHHPTDRIAHTTAFVTPVVEHWLEREIAQWVHPMKDRSDDPPHHERTLYLWATSRSWGSRISPIFTCLKAIGLKIHWSLCKLPCTLVIIWWPGVENHWPWALGHWTRCSVLQDGPTLNDNNIGANQLKWYKMSRVKKERETKGEEGRKEMFYLWLYGVGHMVKDHSDSEKGNPLPPHRLLFPINSKGSFICTIPQTG